MNGLSFAQPWVLGALALVPLLLLAWERSLRRGRRQLRALSRAPAGRGGYAPVALLALAVALAIVAAAQPRWGTRESTLPVEGSELVVVLDVSRSMAATDADPNRLEAAKLAINRTIDRLEGDRVALVIFAGDARLRFPLTTDFAAARQVVSSLETGSVIVRGGTSVSQGLDVALSAFDPQARGGRLILLIGDGDDLGSDPAGAAQRVRDSGASLLVAGVGSLEGATVPVSDSVTGQVTPKLDAGGQPIITRLDEPFLRAIAAAAGGRYLGANLAAVPGAVDGRLSALQRARFAEQTARVPIERFQPFALAALGALLLGVLVEQLPMPSRRSAGLVAAAALALVLFSGCATRSYSLNEDGRTAFARGDYERAVALFREAQAAEPGDFTVTLNLARSLDAAGRFDEAQAVARRALVSPSAKVRNRAYALLGHHRFALGDLEASLDSFKSALLEDPRDENSRRDYEVVLRLLRAAPPPPGSDPATPTPAPGASPAPSPGGGPSPGSGPGGGSPTPTPGQGGQVGPGNAPGQPGGPAGQRPESIQDIERELSRLDGEVQRAIQAAGEQPSAADALRILQLLAERERIAAIRDAILGNADPNDY